MKFHWWNLDLLAVLMLMVTTAAGQATAQGYAGYPYTIMTPERGGVTHYRSPAVTHRRDHLARTGDVQQSQAPAQGHVGRHVTVARGSPGVVLPTPLPRTELIPPENSGAIIAHAPAQEQGPTVVPGLANPVPNLPHGPETFQDRASRCAFQRAFMACRAPRARHTWAPACN